jgi:hypothetical protein
VVERLQRRGAVDVGRAAAHVDRDADRLEHLGAIRAVAKRGLELDQAWLAVNATQRSSA